MEKCVMHYESVCWLCHAKIDSEKQRQCLFCGWYICSECCACAYECISYFSDSYSELVETRKYVDSLPLNEAKSWVRERFLERYEHNREIQERRARLAEEQRLEYERKLQRMEEERLAKLALKREKELAEIRRIKELSELFCIGSFVTHSAFGIGKVVSSKPSGSGYIIRVSFKEAEKSLLLPDAFDNDYLCSLSFSEELL